MPEPTLDELANAALRDAQQGFDEHVAGAMAILRRIVGEHEADLREMAKDD